MKKKESELLARINKSQTELGAYKFNNQELRFILTKAEAEYKVLKCKYDDLLKDSPDYEGQIKTLNLENEGLRRYSENMVSINEDLMKEKKKLQEIINKLREKNEDLLSGIKLLDYENRDLTIKIRKSNFYNLLVGNSENIIHMEDLDADELGSLMCSMAKIKKDDMAESEDEEHSAQAECINFARHQYSFLGNLIYSVPNGHQYGVSNICIDIPNDTFHAMRIDMMTGDGATSMEQDEYSLRCTAVGIYYCVVRSREQFEKEVNDYMAHVPFSVLNTLEHADGFCRNLRMNVANK